MDWTCAQVPRSGPATLARGTGTATFRPRRVTVRRYHDAARISPGAALNPFGSPRRAARLGCVVLVALAGWLLLVPITAVYVVTDKDRTPHEVSTRYSWWTSDQELVYTESGIPPRPAEQTPLIFGFRVSCGTTFTNGAAEVAEGPNASRVCTDVERPRWIGASVLLVVGVLALVVAFRLPAGRREPNRWQQPREQRRLLRRSR